jgi:hypothetical protein
MAEALHRLVYRSVLAIVGTTEQRESTIAKILQSSQQNNAKDDLTGILVRGGETCVQVLEGPLAGIERAYDRISSDIRHTAFDLIQFVPVEARRFASWRMAYVDAAELGKAWEERPLNTPEDVDDAFDLLARRLRIAPMAV